jgi:hypothetical protein
VLETGGAPAKTYNVDRRIFTRAVPDAELGWVRAFRPAAGDAPERTVATIANFAAHPPCGWPTPSCTAASWAP